MIKDYSVAALRELQRRVIETPLPRGYIDVGVEVRELLLLIRLIDARWAVLQAVLRSDGGCFERPN